MNMKNILKVAVLLGGIIAVTYWRVGCSSEETESLMLQNVEAIAADEHPDMNTDCLGSGTVDCPSTYIKVEYVSQGYSLD